MNRTTSGSFCGCRLWRHLPTWFLIAAFLSTLILPWPTPPARAGDGGSLAHFDEGIDAAAWYRDHEIEHAWRPGYLHLATGDPTLQSAHGVYAWPFALDSIGWNIQSYQDYGGTPYFHHGLDMMKVNGTQVFNRSGGQVVNIENYQPGNDLYWEVAVLDPDGYLWQYHHIDKLTIPQPILDKFAEYQADPVYGGFIPADTHIGNIVYWPVMSFGKRFNHIHLNILAAGGVYVNGFEFHVALPDTDGPEIQAVGLLQNGQIYPGDVIEGDYSLYVHARDLVLDNVYYLPPYEVTFSVDGGPVYTTWRFDTLPGGADQYAYLDDFYIVPPTCGDYDCREFYIDLGFIPGAHFEFPAGGGEHVALVTVRDHAGNSASQPYTYTVFGPPAGTVVWQDDFETDLGWVRDPGDTDTATSGLWERGDPENTYSDGFKQLGTTVSGVNDLVTGRLAGTSAGANDVDGGVTSIRSPDIALPAADELALAFYYYLAHGSNASSADYLRVTVVGPTAATVLEELGAANNDDAAWMLHTFDLAAFAGQTVHLLIEAADDGAASLVEAAIDDVLIVGSGLNWTPTADAQSLSTAEDTPLDIRLTGSDPEEDPLTYTVTSSPTHGTLTGTPPALTYTPAPDYYGADSLAFVVDDGHSPSVPAVVSIDVAAVNDAPVASAQSVATVEDTPLDLTLAASDVDGDALTYRVVLSPSYGTLTGTAPALVYLPAANYSGTDSLAFLANDGQVDSAQVVVTIDITPVNDAPVADPLSITTRCHLPVRIVLSGSDVDGDTLTYQVVTGPRHGTLTGSAPNLIYTPDPGYAGSDAFMFVVDDGELQSEVVEVRITILFTVYVPVVGR